MLQKFWPLFVLLTVGVVALALLTSGGGQGAKAPLEELEIEDLIVGDGKEAKSGDTVKVHYRGTLRSTGTKFDASYDRNQPFTTQIGVGAVIKGWDKGIVGMKEGGKRKLQIPARLAYGAASQGGIPPNSDLVFEVELLRVMGAPTEALKSDDLVVGNGKEAKTGDTVEVHYTGTLRSNGKKFDSSHDHGKPFSFTLGQGKVIKGWDLGVAGMKEGGKRKLVIPSELAYGAAMQPGIPPNSDLVFEVELLKVK